MTTAFDGAAAKVDAVFDSAEAKRGRGIRHRGGRIEAAADAAAGRLDASFDAAEAKVDAMAARLDTTLDTAARKVRTAAEAVADAASIAATAQQQAVAAINAASAAIASAGAAAAAASGAAAALTTATDQLSERVDQVTSATSAVAAAERDLIDATNAASGHVTQALTDSASFVRDKLDEAGATASAYVTRVEVAADILGQAHLVIDGLPEVISSLENVVVTLRDNVNTISGQLLSLNQVTSAMTGLKATLDATGTASDRMTSVLTDGSDLMRDFLGNVEATAAGHANRVEVAADILGQAHQAINGLPATVNALGKEVRSISGQLGNLRLVVTAVQELRGSLDETTTALKAARLTPTPKPRASQAPPPSQPVQPPPPVQPPQSAQPPPPKRGLFGFRKRGA